LEFLAHLSFEKQPFEQSANALTTAKSYSSLSFSSTFNPAAIPSLPAASTSEHYF